MFGVTYDEAQALLQAGNMDDLFTAILNKYKKLEEKCDFILCEGTDYTGSLKPFEFDFNAQIANNLGAPILAVVNGNGKIVGEIADNIQMFKNVLTKEKCAYIGMFVNRVKQEDKVSVTEVLKRTKIGDEIDFVIPEQKMLQKITIRHIIGALKADWIYGDDEVLDYDVNDFKIGAMNIEHILKLTNTGNTRHYSG